MSGDEDYVVVQGTLKAKTLKAILIETNEGEGWVARSCLHFSSDEAVIAMNKGDEGEFKIMEWVARDKGLI